MCTSSTPSPSVFSSTSSSKTSKTQFNLSEVPFLNTSTIKLDFAFPSQPDTREFVFKTFDIVNENVKENEAQSPLVKSPQKRQTQIEIENEKMCISPSTSVVKSPDGKKGKIPEHKLYDIFVYNLNVIFDTYGMPYYAWDSHKVLNNNKDMPDITVSWRGTQQAVFYVEIKSDINDRFNKNATQAINYAKDILQEDKNKVRQFSICVLISPGCFAVFCAYLYKDEIMSSLLIDRTNFQWDYWDLNFRKLLGVFLTDFNWYGDLFVPTPLSNDIFSNNTFLMNYSILNFNSSSHHFISLILFFLVLLYVYGMKKKKTKFNRFGITWKDFFMNSPNCNYINPKDLFQRFSEKTWIESFRLVYENIKNEPEPWTLFMDAVCGCEDVYVSWPKSFNKANYVFNFHGFYSVNKENFFVQAPSNFPINVLLTFKAPFINDEDDVPTLPSYNYPEITSESSFLTELNLIFSRLEHQSFFSFQFSEIFSTPFKFLLFLKKYENWESVFSNITFFSSSYLSLNEIKKGRFLGSGLSGEVVEYKHDEKAYAVKFFYSDREAEFKREISTYFMIQRLVPTLEMVSFDLKQQILVLNPVGLSPYKIHGRPKLELFEKLFDDLNKLHRLNLVHRDIRPDNLLFILSNNSERLVLIDWSSSVYADITVSFEGTVRYASDAVLMNLKRQESVSYKKEDDVCSLAKVFLGKVLGVDNDLLNIKNDKISRMAEEALNIWTETSKRYPLVVDFLRAAQSKNFQEIKKLMNVFYYGPPPFMVSFFILLFLFFNLNN
jgi:hypothetical protein